MNDTLEVLVGDTRVGVLERFEDETHVFTFDPAWLVDPERPVLGQFFEDRKPEPIHIAGPPCWFAHLLPQGPLRRAIARRAGIDEGDVFALLYILGEDLPGAVRLRPTRPGRVRRAPASSSPPLLGIHLSALGATLSGVRVPPIRMGRVEEIEGLPDEIPIGDGTMYLIERFDRDPRGGRVHMEDMGQILDRPPGSGQFEGAYEQIAAVLAAIAPGSLREFCQRLAFCVVCGNTDAHLKNWSVVYPDRRHAELSPAYDIIAAVLYAPERIDDRLALELGNAHAFESVTLASFKRLAAVSGVDFSTLGGWIREAVQRAREAWHAHAHELAFLPSERRRLEAHMARVPLLTAS